MNLILLIEDNHQNARLASKLLKQGGYEVIIAADGESGLKNAFETTPILILADLGLPDMDGQTVVALLQQQSHLKDVPIIAFTAWPQSTAAQMAKSYGCHGIITKPINTRTFVNDIEVFLTSPTHP